ncbi:hypothetical protein AB7M31_000664 [Pseudomonas sp. IAP-CY TE4608]
MGPLCGPSRARPLPQAGARPQPSAVSRNIITANPPINPRVAVVSYRYELQMVMVGQQDLARVMDWRQCWASRSNRRWKP